jgi:hypothetical protein
MNTNQSSTGSPAEPNESVAASWLPQSIDDDVFASDVPVGGAYAAPSARSRFRPALAAALLAVGLSAGLAGSAWAHQQNAAPLASGAPISSNTSSPASVLPAALSGGDESDAEDGPALPATGSSVGLTTGAATGGSAAATTATTTATTTAG